jgi:ferredoxin--NADP+ reductase
MAHDGDETRIIEADAPSYNATLVRREDLTPELAYFWVRRDGEPTPFEPGQYMTAGVVADGKLLQRPYSVASGPSTAGTDGYEFFVRLVPVLRFTTALWHLPVGHRMRLIGPKGRFMLEPDDHRTHLYVSTGTGVAPFISMIRETMARRKPRRTVLINGCSYADEFGYTRFLEELEASGRYPVTYVPTVSRPSDRRNDGWTGHVGRAEQIVWDVCRGNNLRPDRTVVYICGNPDMILNVERILIEHGLPGFPVKKEFYWPKRKAPTLAAG